MSCIIHQKDNLICLSFTDDSAKWPSKSNDAQVSYRNGKPFIRHTKEFHRRMAGIKTAYRIATQESGVNPAYQDDKLFCFCLLGSKTRIHDSHNFCKTFGDFAEEVGITSNDRHLTIWSTHKKDCDIMGADKASTDIFITKQPKQLMQQFYQGLLT